MLVIDYLLEKIFMLLGIIFVIIPEIAGSCILRTKDWIDEKIKGEV